MKIALFYHSLRSDWNHGNAHFLRGYASELVARGHEVMVYEPQKSWSLQHLLADHGNAPLERFAQAYPTLASCEYDSPNLEQELEGVSLVIVHEWNSPELIQQLGELRRRRPEMRLLFHDTHHRAVTAPAEIEALHLTHYDGVLAYGQVLTDLYQANHWAAKAWTWHEAADPRVFHPRPEIPRVHDLVWVGNWGDGERAQEIGHFLVEPCRALKLDASVYGVRYPDEARQRLDEAGIAYHGWVENFRVPALFAAHRVTVHIPRGPYARQLHGIPTIRPFEALACGIPLVTAPWSDTERLFTPGEDYLVAHSQAEMTEHLRTILREPALAGKLAERGLATILARHTCRHRVDELLAICSELGLQPG